MEEHLGVPGFLDDLRTRVKDDSFRPLPVHLPWWLRTAVPILLDRYAALRDPDS